MPATATTSSLPPFRSRAAGERAVDPPASLPAEQPLEPASLEADRDDDEVTGDTLALGAVLDRDGNLPLTGVDHVCPPGERTKAVKLVENRFGLRREDATVGALEELAPVRLSQPRPVPRVGAKAVLVVALPPRIEDSAARQDVDRGALVRPLQQADDDRGCCLATADHTHALGHLPSERSLGQPVAAPVEHPRVLVWLASDADRRARAGGNDAV